MSNTLDNLTDGFTIIDSADFAPGDSVRVQFDTGWQTDSDGAPVFVSSGWKRGTFVCARQSNYNGHTALVASVVTKGKTIHIRNAHTECVRAA